MALHRIESFLNEDEVDDQVSTLKRRESTFSAIPATDFGLENASFTWNTTKEGSAAIGEECNSQDNGKKLLLFSLSTDIKKSFCLSLARKTLSMSAASPPHVSECGVIYVRRVLMTD